MKLPPLPLVILDTETTGLVPRVHKVIEYAAVRVDGGKITDEYEQLFAHEEVPPVVEVLTRIRTADLAGKPSFADKKEDILSRIPADAVIVGQNIGFDFGMLKGEGLDLTDHPWIDTSMLASLVFPELESYSLGYLSTVLQLDHEPKHRAMGDVRATLSLLGKCWERLCALPQKRIDAAKEIAGRGPAGYKMLFDALTATTAKQDPSWLKRQKESGNESIVKPFALPPSQAGSVVLMEEPLDPLHMNKVIAAAIKDTKMTHWVTVKNLDATLRRLPSSLKENKELRILYPPMQLLDEESAKSFGQSASFATPDEVTLAIKLAWYAPRTRGDFPLHGGEEAVWNGKIACTAESATYANQFNTIPSVLLLDHRQLLNFLIDPDHAAHGATSGATDGGGALIGQTSVIIDDASMLEDTATKAYGWYCDVEALRAGAQGNDLLTRLIDVLQLLIEKIRQFQDIRYLTPSDLKTPEARGLREQIDTVLQTELTPQVKWHLECARKIFDPENLSNRIAYIEQRPNGNQSLHSVPERIGNLLSQTLYHKHPTTLLVPAGSSDFIPEVIPPAAGAQSKYDRGPEAFRIPITFHENGMPLEDLFTNPPSGKTILLLPGKSSIEDLYVKEAVPLEEAGITLICQGMSGGQGRMQAEFVAAPTPALWLMTPWTFEGIDLPPETVHHLYIKALPFDHPHHPVVSRRSALYRDAFGGYCVPRVMLRLFRLLRTFCRFKTDGGDVHILDERLFSKAYGKRIRQYLGQFASGVEDRKNEVSAVKATPKTVKKPGAKKLADSDGKQLSIF
ncbi:MAG: ATP-dependent DNA helicase DinG [Candidatus Peregrinibacteria bacterium Greene0416_19]|nr:MAG: ATP-dependent DNA helicase DinG [Candidatus Peregrinibacteria bacterium Greene0416_19]